MNNEVFNTEVVPKLYMKMAIPVVLSMVITLVYNLTDTYFVAATNNTNLVAGVSLGMPIFTFLMALGNIFGQGGASLLSRLLGRNNIKDVKSVSSWCFYLSLVVGGIIASIMLVLKQPMLSILGSNEETLVYARDYYIWIVIGAPFVVNSFVHTNLLRTEGKAKEAMIGTIGGTLVNIIFDPILISVVNLGASGAAIATILGYAFTVSYNLITVKRKSNYLSVSIHDMKISSEHKKQILFIGLAAAVTNIMQSISVIFLNQGLLPYGNDKIAAMGIVMKVSMIVLMIIIGLTFGGQPLFGFYYGADNKKRLCETIKFAMMIISGTAFVLSIFVFIFAPQLLSIFMSDNAFIESATLMLRLQVATMPFVGMIMLATVIFQSTGKAIPALILSIARQGVIYVTVIFILSHTFGYFGILCSQAVADVITLFLATILFWNQLSPEFADRKNRQVVRI